MAGPPTTAAWQLFYLLACLVPPGRAFVALVCEYVHAAAAPAAPALDGARDWAVKTWTALKHSTKAGARRQVKQGSTHPPEPLPSRMHVQVCQSIKETCKRKYLEQCLKRKSARRLAESWLQRPTSITPGSAVIRLTRSQSLAALGHVSRLHSSLPANPCRD